MRVSKYVILFLIFISCKDQNNSNIENIEKIDDESTSELLRNEKPMLRDTLIYKSLANGLAEINLKILPNNQFDYFMRIIPQPMSEDNEESVINAKGTWNKNGDWIRLKFQNDELLLKAIFDVNYADENQFKLIDKKTVDINIDLNEIIIYGVLCEKSLK